MKENYKDFIGIYENALNKTTCLEIIDYFDKSDKKAKRNQLQENQGFSTDIEDTFLELYDPRLLKIVKNKLFDCIKNYRKKYRHFPPCVSLKDVKLQKTLPTEGYHVFHHENLGFFTTEYPLIWSLRKAVWTLYLNDVEEGGETEFLYQKLRVKPKQGTICIFPAEFTHTHRGNTPFSGEKYIATGWFQSCPSTEQAVSLYNNPSSIINKGTVVTDGTKNKYVTKNISLDNE